MQDEFYLPAEMRGWQVEDVIGEGSYGVVYKAYKDVGGRRIYSAIKVIEIPGEEEDVTQIAGYVKDEQSIRAYFKSIVDEYCNEIGLMENLKGITNIVSAADFAVEEKKDAFGWCIYIRMEYLTSFTKYMRENEISEDEILQMGMDICSALAVCEKAGIIHRDIKPDNIFVSSMGQFKLGDFGVAKHLEGASVATSLKGSYSYMAPEVAQGKSYDKRVDIYSLGMVLYRLCNRMREPFVDPDKQIVYFGEREQAMAQRMSGEALPAPVDASEELSRIILKACAFDPNERYASAKDMRKDLEKYQRSGGKQEEKKEDKTEQKQQSVGAAVEVSSAEAAVPEADDILKEEVDGTTSSKKKSGNSSWKSGLFIAACCVVGVLLALGIMKLMPSMSDTSGAGGNGNNVAITEQQATEEHGTEEPKTEEPKTEEPKAEESETEMAEIVNSESQVSQEIQVGQTETSASDNTAAETEKPKRKQYSSGGGYENSGSTSGSTGADGTNIFEDLQNMMGN